MPNLLSFALGAGQAEANSTDLPLHTCITHFHTTPLPYWCVPAPTPGLSFLRVCTFGSSQCSERVWSLYGLACGAGLAHSQLIVALHPDFSLLFTEKLALGHCSPTPRAASALAGSPDSHAVVITRLWEVESGAGKPPMAPPERQGDRDRPGGSGRSASAGGRPSGQHGSWQGRRNRDADPRGGAEYADRYITCCCDHKASSGMATPNRKRDTASQHPAVRPRFECRTVLSYSMCKCFLS